MDTGGWHLHNSGGIATTAPSSSRTEEQPSPPIAQRLDVGVKHNQHINIVGIVRGNASDLRFNECQTQRRGRSVVESILDYRH